MFLAKFVWQKFCYLAMVLWYGCCKHTNWARTLAQRYAAEKKCIVFSNHELDIYTHTSRPYTVQMLAASSCNLILCSVCGNKGNIQNNLQHTLLIKVTFSNAICFCGDNIQIQAIHLKSCTMPFERMQCPCAHAQHCPTFHPKKQCPFWK